MLRALIFVLTPLASTGLVLLFGLPVLTLLLGCFILALGTLLFSTGEIAETVEKKRDIHHALPLAQRS